MKKLFFLMILISISFSLNARESQKKMNEIDKNIKLLTEKLTEQPKNLIFRNNLAYLYLEKGLYQKALEHYQIVLEIDPNYLPANYGIGNILFNMTRYSEALIFYEKTLQIDSHFWKGLYGIALIYQLNQNYRSAIEFYEKVIKLEPKQYDSYYFLAKCYEEIGLYNQSVRKYKEFTILVVQSKNTKAYLPFLNDSKNKVNELEKKINKEAKI